MSIEAPHEFRFRTEDFRLEEIESQFVATDQEREIVAGLKAASPIILEGSRGTGKSFLMRVAEVELNKAFSALSENS
jgi:predicted AAA+ superfamily ATPase